jgi:polyhydroxyalkanoate synthase subunit PhaC
VVGGGVADLRPWPSAIVDQGPQRTVHRCRSRKGAERKHAPALLIPPLAAPASCFDLRRGASVVEHLVGRGYPTYVVDYGPIGFADRALGLEHWVEDVLPSAIRSVSADAGGAPVQAIGWCLGGIMLLLAAAAERDLPLASITLIASPFDFAEVRMFAPIRQLSRLTGGALGTALYRMLGGAPAPLVSLGFRITSYDRYLTRPLFLAANLDDRQTIAHMEAVDVYMASMFAYPGRTFGQLYHAFFRVNDLADGRIEMSDRTIDLRDVREPVLAIAGANDTLAPQPAVHHVADLLDGASEVRLETVPGGHLGTLTGMSARDTTWMHMDEFLAGHDEVARAAAAVRGQPAAAAT